MMERRKCMNIPKVRFHGFKEKWREESLSKLFVERHEISTITESLPQLSFTISEGVIYPDDRKSNKRDFLIKDILSKKYLVTCVGDILYNPANVIYGAIHRNSLCDGVVSPIYKIFKTEQDSNFMECVVRNPSFISQLSMKTEGTVTKLKTLKPESFLEMIVKIAPSIYEQRKIASYFQTLDSLIQTTSKKLASLKQIKAASLQYMFPQEGETVPKVRFKVFEGEWEEKSFSALYKKSIIKNDLTFGTDKIISVANMYYLTNVNVSDLEYLKTYNIMKLGDIAFEGNKSKRFLHGRFVENTIGDGIVSHVFVVFHPISAEHDINYWKYAINNENIMRNVLIRCTKSSTMMTDLVVDDFLKETILVPSYAEQQKIGAYFRNLDQQISLQTQRLEKLKQIKAACLDKMFV